MAGLESRVASLEGVLADLIVAAENLNDGPNSRHVAGVIAAARRVLQEDEGRSAFASDVTALDAFDRLPDDRQSEILELVRIEAADEGCRWSELEFADMAHVQAVAGWSDDDLADVLGEVAPDLFAEAGYGEG